MAEDVKKTVDDYAYFLNKAMAIHAENAVQNLPFDKTELVEIVDITNRDKGSYIVWNGSTRYTAYSTNYNYKIGLKVYVTIPKNDYRGQKIITGVYHNDDLTQDDLYDYELPLSTYQQKATIFSDTTSTFGLITNYNQKTKEIGDEYLLLTKITNVPEIISKYLALSANFKAAIGENVSGEYGLQIIVDGKDKQDNDIERIFYLRSSDMIGNIYNFNAFTEQQAIFNIEEFNAIGSIQVYFFQDGNFVLDGTSLTPVNNGQIIPQNIFINGISIFCGDDKPIAAHNLILYSTNGLNYNSRNGDEYNAKDLKIKWEFTDLINGDTSQEPTVIMSDEDADNLGFENLSIHWYKSVTATEYLYQQDYIGTVVEQYEQEESVLKRWKEWDDWVKIGKPVLPKEKMPAWSKIQEDVGSYNQYMEDLTTIQNDYLKNSMLYFNQEAETLDDTFLDAGKALLEQRLNAAKKALEGEKFASNGVKGWNEIYSKSFKNNIAGENWCLIDESLSYKGDESLFSKENVLPDLDNKTTQYKVIIEYGPWRTEVNPETEETYLVIGEYNTTNQKYQKIESNILELTNTGDVPEELEKKNGLAHFEFSDGLNGNYRSYDGNTGMIISSEFSEEIREVTAVCSNEKDESYLLPATDIVIWEVPVNNTRTMFNTHIVELDTNEVLERSDELFKLFAGTLSYSPSRVYIKKTGEDKYSLLYQIAQAYRASATNNTITCYIIQKTGIIKITQDISFSQFTYDGSNYMFTLNLGQLICPVSKGLYKDDGGKKKNEIYQDKEIWPAGNARTLMDIDFKVIGPQESYVSDYVGNLDNAYREIEIHLYDAKNREVKLTNKEKDAIIKPWRDGENFFYGNPHELKFITVQEESDGEEPLDIRVAVKYNRKLWGLDKYGVTWEDTYGVILEAKYLRDEENTSDILYHQLLSIPIVKSLDYKFNGPTTIVYDTTGNLSCMLPQNTNINCIRNTDNQLRVESDRWAIQERELQDTINQASAQYRAGELDGVFLDIAKENYQKELEKYNERIADITNNGVVTNVIEHPYVIGLFSIDGAEYDVDDNGKVVSLRIPERNFNCSTYLKITREGIIEPSETFKRNDKYPKIGITLKFAEYTASGNDKIYYAAHPIAIVQNRFNVPGKMAWFDTTLQADDGGYYNTVIEEDSDQNPKTVIQHAAASSLTSTGEGKVSGALVGTLTEINGDVQTLQGGLFGFNENKLVFKIGTDGEAFLGAKGAGRINFSGNSGQIMSQSRVDSIDDDHPDGAIGSLFDLRSGKIELVSDKENSLARVVLSTTSVDQVENADTDEVYFSVNDKEGHRLISIGDIDTVIDRYEDTNKDHKAGDIDYEGSKWGNFFIKTRDFCRPGDYPNDPNRAKGAGLRIDLSNGNFESYADFTIMSSDNITLDGETTIRDNLYIDSNLYINGHQVQLINGAIQTTAGDLMQSFYTTSIGVFQNTQTTIEDEQGRSFTRGPYVERSELTDNNSNIYDKISSTNQIPVNRIGGLHIVATSGSYNDLDDKPSFLTQANLSNYYTKDVIDRIGEMLVRKNVISNSDWADAINNGS